MYIAVYIALHFQLYAPCFRWSSLLGVVVVAGEIPWLQPENCGAAIVAVVLADDDHLDTLGQTRRSLGRQVETAYPRCQSVSAKANEPPGTPNNPR